MLSIFVDCLFIYLVRCIMCIDMRADAVKFNVYVESW